VIVNHSHQFIFIHVPKAAGTSVSELFSEYSTYRDLEVGGTLLGEALQTQFKKRFHLTKHATAREVRSVVGDDVWGRYLTFSFVRDPYARAQSMFHFMKRWRGNKDMDPLAFMDKMPDFRTFVLSPQFRKQKKSRILWPQASWVQDDAGKPIVDVVGRVESLDDDLAQVLARLPNLPLRENAPAEAPKKNASASDDEELHSLLAKDPEVESRIYESYKVDFDSFGYARFGQ
jgi:Sulfotransferase family